MPFSNFFKRGEAKAAAPPIGEPVAVSPWLAQNQETLDELARFVDFAEGFTLGFLEINFEKDLDEVLKALRKRPECATVQFHTFTLDDPNLRFLKDALEDKIQQLPPPISQFPEKKRVILVRGLENAIGLFGDYNPLLNNLNFVRDILIDSTPYPVLFCLPSYAINRIIEFAPDLWSWKSGIFCISTDKHYSDEVSISSLHAQKMIGSASKLERQERISLLEKLAKELGSSQIYLGNSNLFAAIQVLTELGIARASIGDFPRAWDALCLAEQAFGEETWQPENQRDLALRIQTLTWKGFVAMSLGEVDQAESMLLQALALNTGVDDDLKGLTSLYLGELKTNQGKLGEALSFFWQSLEIRDRIEDVIGQAATLHQIGRIKASQGEVDEAMSLYQQSLEIQERIGDAQGKAANLNQMGRLKANQGEVEAAIALFQQSLEIEERIGNAQGKAATLANLGQLLADKKGDFATAIPYLQESLAILQRIGSPEAATAAAILTRITPNASQGTGS
jgi:tetratricopeptide (TPR) repeat protein